MTLWIFIIRQWKSRPGRAILTLLSVVIGVAAVLSVAAVTSSTRRAYINLDQGIAGRAALEISTQGAGGFDERYANLLKQVPGVETLEPLLERSTILYFKGKRLKLLALGIGPQQGEAGRDYKIEEGRFELGENNGIISAEYARGLGIHVGDVVRILTRRGIKRITITGLLAKQGKMLFHQGVLLLGLEDAQELFAANGRVDKILIILKGTASEQDVAEQIGKHLPKGLFVGVPTERTELASETLAIIERALGFSGALSLLLATAVIFNTFLMNVSERRRQFGILRAIGATRWQIAKLVLGEGVLLGAAGIILGIPVGLIGSRLLAYSMEEVLGATLPISQLSLGPYLLAIALGLSVSLLAAYLPARKASRVSPLQAVAGSVAEAGGNAKGGLSLIPLAGAVVIFISFALMAAALAGWIPINIMTYCEVVVLVGFAMLIPAVLIPLTRLIAWVISLALNVELRLAKLQIVRRRTRSTLTVAVLLVAMAFVISIGSTAINTIRDVRNWSQRMITGDYFLLATLPDVATAKAVELPRILREEIANIKGVANVDTVRYVNGRVGKQAVIVIARDFTARDHMPLDLRRGSPDTARAKLLDGEAIIGTALAQRLRVGINGEFLLNTRNGPQALRVAGIANDYTVGGMTIYLHTDTAKRLLDVEGVDAFIIDSDPSMQTQVETSLRAFCEDHGLLFLSSADLHILLDRMTAGMLMGLWMLLALGFVIASCAVYNTLTIDVLEQTRELCLLRVVGMTRRQVRRMVVVEALIISVVGLVPGLFIGVMLATLNHVSAARLLGHELGIEVSPSWLAGCLVLAITIILAAAWFPAQRAARLNLTSALQEE